MIVGEQEFRYIIHSLLRKEHDVRLTAAFCTHTPLIQPVHIAGISIQRNVTASSTALGLGARTLDFARLRLLDVMGGDPLGVVGRGRRHTGGRRIRSCLSRRSFLLRAPATAFLWEVGRNPHGVEEVNNAGKEGEDEQIQEDAG